MTDAELIEDLTRKLNLARAALTEFVERKETGQQQYRWTYQKFKQVLKDTSV